MSPAFAPHGHYEAHIEGALLLARTQGNWNAEMHRKSADISGPLIRQLNVVGPWAYLVEIVDTLVYQQQVLDMAGAWVRLPLASRLAGAAWVMSPRLEGYGLLMPRYRAAYGGAIPCEVFNEVDAARAWLLQRVAGAPGQANAG